MQVSESIYMQALNTNNKTMKKHLTSVPISSPIKGLQSDVQREVVLKKMYFYGNVERKPIFKDFNYSLPKLSSKVWLESYKIFENETQLILNYLTSKFKEKSLESKINDSYEANLDSLIDLKELHNNQLLMLRVLNIEQVERFVHRYKLRMGLDDLTTYLQCRNFVYLTFMILLQYSERIDEEFIYLLLVLMYSIIYVQWENLTYFNNLFELVDYSVYEISFLLNPVNRKQFENLISNSIKLFSVKRTDAIVAELLMLLVGEKELSDNSLIETINSLLFDNTVNKKTSRTLGGTSLRQDLQQTMHAMDYGKIKKERVAKNISAHPTSKLLDDIISSQSIHDRFSSSYEISDSSKNLLNILINNSKKCAETLVNEVFQINEENYHIHELSTSQKLHRCIISMNITIVQYFDIMSDPTPLGESIYLKNTGWWNTNSSLTPKSGPSITRATVSTKLGLRQGWIKQSLIINHKQVDFTSSYLKTKLSTKSNRIIEILQVEKTNDSKILKDLELLSILEHLFHRGVFNAYEVEIFENSTIIFISLDTDQQDMMSRKKLEIDLFDKLKKLMGSANINIVLLID